MLYTSFDPEAKVIGQAMLGFSAVVEAKEMVPLLIKHGLTDVQPDQWYPLQKWLDLLTDLSQTPDKMSTMLIFIDIGSKVANNIFLPEEVLAFIRQNGFVAFMVASASATYYRDHQGYVGKHQVEKISANHFKMTLQTPYPPDFWYGLCHGLAARFCPLYVVHYEDIAMHSAAPGETVILHTIVEG